MSNPLLGPSDLEADMQDLTAELENLMHAPAVQDDDIDLGDGADLHVPSLDRYHMLYEDDEPGPLGGPHAVTASTLEHPNLTYGNLVQPSTHEDLHYVPAAAGPLTADTSHYTATPEHRAPSNGVAGHHEPLQAAAQGRVSVGGGHAGLQITPPVSGSAASAGLQTSPGVGLTSPTGGGGRRGARKTEMTPLHFTVTDPVRMEPTGILGLLSGHVTYLVTTQLREELPGYTRGKKFAVRRRFREFVALASVLKVRYRGYFLPPRPEKNAVEGSRMTDSFVEERRVALERYLNRLAQHPVVARSEELRVFVTVEGDLEGNPLWTPLLPPASAGLVEGTAKLGKQLFGLENSVLDPVQAAQPTKKTADPLRAIREKAQAMTANSAGPNVTLPPGEAELRRERESMEAKRDALMSASRSAERLVHRLDRVTSVYADMGLTLFKLSKLEESQGPHMAQFTGTVKQTTVLKNVSKLMATSLVKAGRIMKKTVGRQAYELTALHDALAGMPPALKGMTTREKQLLTSDTLTADVDTKQRYIKDLEAASSKVVDSSKTKRIEDLKNDIAKLQCSITAAKAEYDRIAVINREELIRMHSEYQTDILRMAQGFAAVQASNAQRTAEVWLQLANELNAPPAQLAQIKNVLREAQQISPAGVNMQPSLSPSSEPCGSGGQPSSSAGPSTSNGHQHDGWKLSYGPVDHDDSTHQAAPSSSTWNNGNAGPLG